MAALRFLIACSLLLGTAAAALADAPPLDMATQTACKLDRVREIIAGAEASSATPEEANRLIVENTADWLPDYTAFATGPEVADLRTAAEADPLSAAACRALLPFAPSLLGGPHFVRRARRSKPAASWRPAPTAKDSVYPPLPPASSANVVLACSSCRYARAARAAHPRAIVSISRSAIRVPGTPISRTMVMWSWPGMVRRSTGAPRFCAA